MAERCRGHFIKDFEEHSPTCLRCAEAAVTDGKTQCTVCGLALDGSDMERHMRLHDGERPFRCAVCLEAFARKAHLVIHLRRHTNLRPFACADCGRTFPDAAGLRQHRSVHTVERPFACPDCARTFKLKSNLMRHQRRAHGYWYTCRRCSAMFDTRLELTEHYVRHRNTFRRSQLDDTC